VADRDSADRAQDSSIEAERYELFAGPAYRFEVPRRDFFKVLGAGLVVAFALPSATAQESGGARRGDAMPADVSAWLHIGEDGRVSVFTGKAEVGQNIRTSLSQVVAEELRVGVGSITMVMADTAVTPFDMGTFGSRTTPIMAAQLRKVAAAAREMLVELAAQGWGVDRGALVARAASVTHPPTGRRAGYGELSKGQKLVKTIGDDVATVPAERWTVAGQSVPTVTGRDVVTGRQKYTSDLGRPGMAYGRVLRAPSVGAALVSVDTTAAAALPGVTVVRDGDFVGVSAPNSHLAGAAMDAVRAQWRPTPQPSGAELFEYLRKNPTDPQGADPRSRYVAGVVETGLAAAATKHDATYTVAYIAHVPLEPRAAVAEWQEGALTVWTGTQRPFGVRSELAEAFRIPEEKVRVIVPDTGSGYGGKHTGEAAIEAARLAKGAGRPVKVAWSREEEFTWAYFRPAGVIDVKSGVGADGRLTAWEFHNYNSGASGIRTPYDVPNQKIEFHATRSPLRQGSYRGLAATANHFARESHMDELAHARGQDPLEFRLQNLSDARLRAVLQAAAERFGWGKAKATAERGFGLACGLEKGGYVATCAEVTIARPSGEVRVARAVTAFECGAIVNPDHLRNQVEGSVVMGLGGALFEAVQFDAGEVNNPKLSLYRVPRFSDAPILETVLLDRKDLPSAGAGETPIIGLAPAVAGALFAATGTRRRSLPLAPKGISA
jgi:nicotinate dehydrogenase subunit B